MESDDFTRHYIIRYLSACELVLTPDPSLTKGQHYFKLLVTFKFHNGLLYFPDFFVCLFIDTLLILEPLIVSN